MKRKGFLYLILPVITLVLELLPYGAVCNFANPEGEPWRRTFSYFSLTPFGYANFAPLLTALLTCVLLVLLTVYCVTGSRRAGVAGRCVCWLGVVASLGPLLLGIRFFSWIGLAITACLLLEALWLYRALGVLRHSPKK